MQHSLFIPLILLTSTLYAQTNPLETIIEQQRDAFSDWATHPDSLEVQVLYTQIDRRDDGTVALTTHRWGTTDTNQYFYPASTVKMPVAALALQKLNELGVLGMDHHTTMLHGRGTSPASAAQSPATIDTTSKRGLPSIGHYIRKIFLTSDNDAYNRLFEWLGPTYINKALQQVSDSVGTGSRILHRVGVGGFDEVSHTYLNPVRFIDGYEELYQIGERRDTYYDPLPNVQGQQRGVAFQRNDSLINEPFDFSRKNYLSVRNLHDILVRIVLPQAASRPFQLTEADYTLLRDAMSLRPRESDYPRYDKADNYVKFWLYGDQPEGTEIPDNVRILNKVGWAYGYLTDAAYITDGEVEFILVGTIHTNANRVFNDGVYEYETVGMPFFGELGRAILAFERARH